MMEVSRNHFALYKGCLNSCAVEPGIIVSAFDRFLSVVLKGGNIR